MMAEELRNVLKTLERAYGRLKEALLIDPREVEIAIDATIQRFEFTFELAWKAVKKIAEFLGAGECNSGRGRIKLAYRLGWITDEDKWLSLLEARNLTSHAYSKKMAWEVYKTVKEEHVLFEELISTLNEKIARLLDNRISP